VEKKVPPVESENSGADWYWPLFSSVAGAPVILEPASRWVASKKFRTRWIRTMTRPLKTNWPPNRIPTPLRGNPTNRESDVSDFIHAATIKQTAAASRPVPSSYSKGTLHTTGTERFSSRPRLFERYENRLRKMAQSPQERQKRVIQNKAKPPEKTKTVIQKD